MNLKNEFDKNVTWSFLHERCYVDSDGHLRTEAFDRRISGVIVVCGYLKFGWRI